MRAGEGTRPYVLNVNGNSCFVPFGYHRYRHTDANSASKHIMNKKLLAFLFVLFFIASCALAQDANSALRPPEGSQLAVVVVEDMQIPQCPRAAPLVVQAAKTYKLSLD